MTLRKKLISRISFFSFLFMLIFGAPSSILFTSCSNLFDDEVSLEENLEDESDDQNTLENKDDSPNEDSANKENEKAPESVTIKGQVCLTGAVPEVFAASRKVLKAARSALPSYTDTEVEYFAFAESGSKTVDAKFDTEDAEPDLDNNAFSITLASKQNWTITCGIKEADTENSEKKFLLTATSAAFDPEDLTSGETLKFFPTPDITNGDGQIDLSLIIDSSIKSVKLTVNGSNKENWPFATASVSSTSATIKTVAGSSVESVHSGTYEVLFSFYDASNSLVYNTVQNITVCKGMTTRVWVTSGGESPIDSNGIFSVTAAKIQAFASTNFFVAEAALGTSEAGFLPPSDSNSGSHKAPFATLGHALSHIATYGQSAKDYKIHISGHHTVAAAATAGFSISGLDSNMKSLTISGLNNNTTNILDGDERFCTLYVDSSKEVTIENLTIKKGNAENGGGIAKSGTGKLILDNCIITANNATSSGGGIYISAGDIIFKDVEISNNHAAANAGGIFFNSAGIKSLTLGTSTSSNTIIVKNNTGGTSSPYKKSNVYLNTTDELIIGGALSTECQIGITRAGLLSLTGFTSGFKSKNPSTAPSQIFFSDDDSYEVTALALSGEARLSVTVSAGATLNWYYSSGDANIRLSSTEMENLGLPERHNKLVGTSFILDKSSSGPFYDAETNDAAIFTGSVYINNPVSGTQVTSSIETSVGIPYAIAASAITEETNLYIKLDVGTVYLDPENGDDDNGGWNKDIPVKTVAQAKRILKNNAKTDPALIVMGSLNDKSEIEALSGLTRTSTGATSEYNGAIVKRHSSFTNAVLISIPASLTLQNVTLDGGAVWSKTQTEIEADPELLVTRTNTGVSSSSYLVNASKAATFEDVIIQNVDNTSTSNSGNGAAAYISSYTLTLNNCLIKDCRSTHGAIFAASNGKINATNTRFLCNNSIGSGSDKGHGGAVYLYGGSNSGGQATFDACSFNFNAANYFGGALYVGNNASATFTNQGTNSLANNFSNMATAAASRTCKGDFAYTRGKLTLLGDFAFGGGADALSFYIDNSSSSAATPSSQHPIYLGGSFGGVATTGTAKIYLAKNLEASYGEAVLQQVASDTSVNLSSAKVNFALENNTPSICEIDNNGKISPLPSGGSFYTAMDYIFTLSADKTQVTRGEDSVITITPTVKRKEANGSQTLLYYNPSDSKLYEDAAHTIAAAGSNTVSWSASLMCGTDVEVESLNAASSANQFTIPGISWEDNYTLNVTATYLGIARDTSFAVECVAHAFNATPYTVISSNYVYFGDWPQSAKASTVTVNESVSVEIGALIYYLGSDNAWYAKYDDDYFKVEPVKWKILTTDYNGTGYKLLFATKILEGRPYDSSSTKYDTSAVRAYLNGDFMNTAFSTVALQSIIQTVEIDNSARSTNPDTNPTMWSSGANPYACDNTNDQVFLLSLQEITTAAYGFSTDASAIDGNRNYSPTAYALKNGANSGGWWMTRSPDVGAGYLRYSNENGRANGGTTQWRTNAVGLVPAICIMGE